MGIREDVLALADELDGVSTKESCDACLASGTELCRGDLECSESAHKACAKRLREIVEHEAEDVTTVSAYDLLPDDERKAIAWMREHGGIAEVKDEWKRRNNLKRRLEKAQDKVGRQQRHIEELQRKLAERRDGINAMRSQIAEMSKRLMPEGMEWPKVDGEPVDFKTLYEPSLGVLEAVSIYSNGACEVMGHDGIIKDVKEIHVETPKVLDADGEEIREGDVLYSVETDGSVTVDSIEPGNPWFATTDGTLQHCAKFTHRAPVLGADKKPLRVGETVWAIGDALTSIQVLEIKPSDDPDEPEHLVWCGETWGEPLNYAKKWRIPDQLTHEQPDTWERLEADARMEAFDYVAQRKPELGEDTSISEDKCIDLVRRARALAERERGE